LNEIQRDYKAYTFIFRRKCTWDFPNDAPAGVWALHSNELICRRGKDVHIHLKEMLFDSTCSTDNNSPNGASPAPLPWRQPQQQWRQQQAHKTQMIIVSNHDVVVVAGVLGVPRCLGPGHRQCSWWQWFKDSHLPLSRRLRLGQLPQYLVPPPIITLRERGWWLVMGTVILPRFLFTLLNWLAVCFGSV